MTTESAHSITGRDRFRNFRDMLREHGFQLQCQHQSEGRTTISKIDARTVKLTAEDPWLEVWRALNTETGRNVTFIVTIGAHGFDLFHQSQSIAFQDDVARIVKATGGDPGEGFEDLDA